MTAIGAEEIVARVEANSALIEGSAATAEQNQRLPPELVKALHEAELFRLLLPTAYGGLEVGPPVFLRAIEAVAKLDASTAWCLCQGNGCAMTAAYLDEAVAADIWRGKPDAVLAWGPGSKCTARPEEASGGFRLSGSWSFVSGIRNATWLGGHAVELDGNDDALRDEAGKAIVRTYLLPASEAQISECWDVVGLRATASDSYSVENVLVPAGYAVGRDQAGERRVNSPLYLFPAMSLYAFGFSGTALGIARSMLESFKELTREKRPRLARAVLKDDGMIQADTAIAEARLNAARAYLISEAEDIWAAVQASNELTIEQRMRIRLVATFAINEAKAVADVAYDLAGATAIFASGPFERRFRDIHTVAQQLQGRKSHFQTVGAYLLGHPADMSVI